MTPSRPPGPSTGTDQELAIFAVLARSPKTAHEPVPAWMLSSITGRCVVAAIPTGPPPAPDGSRDQAASTGVGTPKEAAHTSSGAGYHSGVCASPPSLEACPPGAGKWMHKRSLPSAAPSADRISDRLDDGSEEPSRPVSLCSRVSW